jgi:hypothetical protein
MKLYSYSSALLTFAEVKWARVKYCAGGFFIVVVIVFGFIALHQPIGNALGFRSENTLAVENDVLRQELSLMSPRVSKLERKVRQLREDDNILHLLVYPRKIAGDTVSRFTDASKGTTVQSPVTAAVSFSR